MTDKQSTQQHLSDLGLGDVVGHAALERVTLGLQLCDVTFAIQQLLLHRLKLQQIEYMLVCKPS